MIRVGAIEIHPAPYRAPVWRNFAHISNIELTVLTMSNLDFGHTYQKIDESGYHRIVLSAPLLVGQHGLYWNKDICKVLSRQRFDVIVVPGYSHPTSLIAAIWARIHRTPFIYTADSTLLGYHNADKRIIRDMIVKSILRSCSAVWVPGRVSRAYMQHYGIPNNHIFEGCYCLDIVYLQGLAVFQREQRISIRSSLGFDPDDFVLLYAGRFIPARDLTTLLKGFSIALRTNSQLGLILVGDGPDRQCLEQLSKTLTGRVAFIPFTPISKVGSYYYAADAYILTSVADPYSVGFIHGAICGLPLLCTTAVGTGYDYLLPGKTGFWMSVGDEYSVANAMCTLSENRSRAVVMGKEAALVAATRTPIWAAKQLEKAVICALHNRKTRISS